MSWPSLSCRVACTSISVSTPKPCALSASRTRAAVSANGAWMWMVSLKSVFFSPSREGEERLLHLLLGHRGIGVPGQAFPHAAGHDLEAGPVQGAGYRGELGDHVGPRAPGLHYRYGPRHLA